jgi:hypothetical protein
MIIPIIKLQKSEISHISSKLLYIFLTDVRLYLFNCVITNNTISNYISLKAIRTISQSRCNNHDFQNIAIQALTKRQSINRKNLNDCKLNTSEKKAATLCSDNTSLKKKTQPDKISDN